MMRRRHSAAIGFLLPALAGLCLAVRPVGPDDAARPKTRTAAWTIMLYMAADCDLEALQIDNVDSMLGVGSSPDVHVLLLLDRSAKDEKDRPAAAAPAEPSDGVKADQAAAGETAAGNSAASEAADDDPTYTNRPLANLGNWSGAKLLYVERGRLQSIADWGPVNTGDPAILKRFLDTATLRYPARRYALILNGHGLGWSGVCHDEAHDDLLTTPELRAVLSQTTRSAGPLELLGFDACLMANFEALHSLGPFARVLVASEEMEPGEGWDYVKLLGRLQKHPAATGLEVGETIAETFHDYFEQHDAEALSAITLSVVRSDRLPPVGRAIDELALALRRQLASDPAASWLKLARARARTLEFGRQDSPEGAAHLDLVHLCELLAKEFPAEEFPAKQLSELAIQTACRRVTAAVRTAVTRNIHSSDNPNSNGLSIFFPAIREILEDDIDVPYNAIEFSRQGAWFAWLGDFIGEAERHEFHPLLKELRVDRSRFEIGSQLTVTSSIENDGYNEVYLALATGHGEQRRTLAEASTQPDENLRLADTWSGHWYTIENGPQHVLCPVLNWHEVPANADSPDRNSLEGNSNGNDQADNNQPGNAATEPSPRIAEIPAQVCRRGSGAWHDVGLVFEIDAKIPQSRFIDACTRDREVVQTFVLNRGDELRLLRGTIDGNGARRLVPVPDQPLITVTDPHELRINHQPLPPGTYQIGYLASNQANAFEEEFVEVELEAGKR